MPTFTESDFSAYFTITSPPETFARSVSQSLSPSESLSVAVSLFRYERTIGDSLSSSDNLSRAVSTFRQVFTLTDSLSTSESLSKTVSTFRQETTLSDSFSNSESLSRAIDTWRHVFAYNMTLTPSESLSKAVRTYRHNNSFSDSISPSDSLSLNVTTFKFINSISQTLSVSESLNVATQLWFNTFTSSDTVSVSDGLTVQTTIANDTYFYDNYGMDSATKLVGYINSGNFTSDTDAVTNIIGLYDSATFLPATYKGASHSKACVVFDFGSQVNVDFIAVFVQSALTNPLKLYGSNSQGSGYNLIANMFGSDNNWQVSDFTAVTYRYFAVQIENMSSDVKVGEFLIGKQFKPEVRFDIGASIQTNYHINKNESLKGSEYAYKTQDSSNKINRAYSNISETLKSNFEDLSKNGNNKKIIYNFNNFYYGLVEPMQFEEIAHNRYQTQLSILT